MKLEFFYFLLVGPLLFFSLLAGNLRQYKRNIGIHIDDHQKIILNSWSMIYGNIIHNATIDEQSALCFDGCKYGRNRNRSPDGIIEATLPENNLLIIDQVNCDCRIRNV